MDYILRYLSLARNLILIISLFIPSIAATAEIKALYFYETGCKWCEYMDNVMSDESVKGIISRNMDVVKIKVRRNGDIHEMGIPGENIVGRYRITGTPTLIFLNIHGEELLRIPGAVTKDDFKDLLCNYVIGIKHKDKDCLTTE